MKPSTMPNLMRVNEHVCGSDGLLACLDGVGRCELCAQALPCVSFAPATRSSTPARNIKEARYTNRLEDIGEKTSDKQCLTVTYHVSRVISVLSEKSGHVPVVKASR